jgi:GrpB-like predicted nucleotidyltransferase (UPF0157 family)
MWELFVPDPASPEYHLVARPPERPRSHHLHVCLHGSAHEARHLAVRDFLRSHPEERVQYEAVKRQAVALSPGDRLGYMDRKRGFLDDLEKRAVTWRSRTSPG